MSELKLSPWGDRLYIILDEPKESVGAIILPERHSERSRVATVSAVGKEVKHIKVGNKVLISYYTGVFIHLPDFAFRGKEDLHRIVREDEILAKIVGDYTPPFYIRIWRKLKVFFNRIQRRLNILEHKHGL